MILRFTIIREDLTETIIDEPVGWDSISKTIQRDADRHGIFFNFSESNLEFADEAYWIIKEQYILNRVDGDVGLRIEWLCDDCEGYQVLYDGKLDFNRYNEKCGDDCSIQIGLEASEVEVLISNRQETSVDLTSNKAYDGTTVLTDYDGLGKDVQIPGKGLKLINLASKSDASTYRATSDAEWPLSFTGFVYGAFVPGLDNADKSELEPFTPGYIDDFTGNWSTSNPQDTEIFQVQEQTKLRCLGSDYHFDGRFKGSISYYTFFHVLELTAKLCVMEVRPDGGSTLRFGYDLVPVHVDANNWLFPYDQSFSFTLSSIVSGTKYYYYIYLTHQNRLIRDYYVDVTTNKESFFQVESSSLCPPSPAKTYFIHEAMSRVIESITNNRYKLKSSLYGRTDSMPYSFAQNGCAGLRTLTNGLQLRRAVLQDLSNPKVFLSLKDGYESLNAIDCIGMGVEGNDVRIEDINYFYTNDIIFVADGVNEINTTVRNERIYNQFNFGYDKFETESLNGLDAVHTKRQYRLAVKNSDQKLEKYSKMIADGYAIEVTRRKYGTTEDWRYDQNIFIICLKRSERTLTGGFNFSSFATDGDGSQISPGDQLLITGSASNDGLHIVNAVFYSGTYQIQFTTPVVYEASATITIQNITRSFYEVEQNNISSPANIFDPTTVLNYAITPIRNAMRWFKWVIQGIRSYTTTKLLFSSGDGNYVAKGYITSDCVSEAGIIAENETLEVATFDDPAAATPFIDPEKVTFKFPMGMNEFVYVASRKYGKVQYRRMPTDEWKYGWIDSLKFNPNDGDADFALITSK